MARSRHPAIKHRDRDPETLGDVTGGACRSSRACEPIPPSPVSSAAPGRRPGQQLPLHLRQGRHEVKVEAAGRSRSIDTVGEAAAGGRIGIHQQYIMLFTSPPHGSLVLPPPERFTLGLRTRRTGEARLFRLKSEFRLHPESKPL